MPRPTTKAALQQAADAEFARLWERLDALPASLRDDIAVQADIEDQSRNPRDVLAHLHAWHLLMLQWYAEGMAGDKPAIPAPGHTWRDTPALNAAIWERYRDTPYAEAADLLRGTHARVREIIDAHTDAELFTKRHYPWTGSTSLGAFLVSSTSSHYAWGVKTLRAIATAAVRAG